MSGAYAYFGRSGNHLRVGPSDGNFGGEIVQTYKQYTNYFNNPVPIPFTMTIFNGSITVTVDGADYTRPYGIVKALNSQTAYAWDEFEHGAYAEITSWPSTNSVDYDITINCTP